MSNDNHNRKRRASAVNNHNRGSKRRRISTVNVQNLIEIADDAHIEDEKRVKKHITVAEIKKLDLDKISVEVMNQKTARRKRRQIEIDPEYAVKVMMQDHGLSSYVAAAMVDRQHKHLDRIGNTKKPPPPSLASMFTETANDLKKHTKIKQAIYKDELKWRVSSHKQITVKMNSINTCHTSSIFR